MGPKARTTPSASRWGGESATLDPCTFAAPEGKVFAGWAVTSDGEVVYSDGEEVSDLAGVGETVALYAIWEDAAKLTFSSTSPVDSTVTSMAFAAGSTVTTSGFVIDGYELVGWYTEVGGEGTMVLNADGSAVEGVEGYVDADKKVTVTTNTTVYAKWRLVNMKAYIGYFELDGTTVTGYQGVSLNLLTKASEEVTSLSVDNVISTYTYGVLIPNDYLENYQLADTVNSSWSYGTSEGIILDGVAYTLCYTQSAAETSWQPLSDTISSAKYSYDYKFGATLNATDAPQVRTASQLAHLGWDINDVSKPLEADLGSNYGSNDVLRNEATYVQSHNITLDEEWRTVNCFKGAYSQSNGAKVTLTDGFKLAARKDSSAGIFKEISGGSVDMDIVAEGSVAPCVGSSAAPQRVGVLAAVVSGGTVNGSSITVNAGSSLTVAAKSEASSSKTDAGLFVGYATAEVSGVTLTLNGDATVSAEYAVGDYTVNAGGLVGKATAAVGGTVTGAGLLKVESTLSGASEGSKGFAIAGGIVGLTSAATPLAAVDMSGAQNVQVVANDNTEYAKAAATVYGASAGGLIGYVNGDVTELKASALPTNLAVKANSVNTVAHSGGIIGTSRTKLSGVEVTIPASSTVTVEGNSDNSRTFCAGVVGYAQSIIENVTFNLDGKLEITGVSPTHQSYGGIVGDSRTGASGLTLNANAGGVLTITQIDATVSGAEGDMNLGGVIGNAMVVTSTTDTSAADVKLVNSGATITLTANTGNSATTGKTRVGGVAGSLDGAGFNKNVSYEATAGSLAISSNSTTADSAYVCAGGAIGDITSSSEAQIASGLNMSLTGSATASISASSATNAVFAGGLVGRDYVAIEDASISVKNASDTSTPALSINAWTVGKGTISAGVAMGAVGVSVTQSKPMVEVKDAYVSVSGASAGTTNAYVGGVFGSHSSSVTFDVAEGVKLSEVTGDRDTTHIDLYSASSPDKANVTCGICNGTTDHNTLTQGTSTEADKYLTCTYLDGMVDTAGDRVGEKVQKCLYPKYETYTVTFDYQYDGNTKTAQVLKGATVAAPDPIKRKGYEIEGWYTDKACTKAFDFSTSIDADTTLYAKWKETKTVYYVGYFELNSSNALTGFAGTQITEQGDDEKSETVSTLSATNDIASYSYGVLVPENTSTDVLDSSWTAKAQGPAVSVDGAAYTLWYYNKASADSVSGWKPMADYSTTYSFEYDFGATLSEGDSVTNREVRTPSQLMHLSFYMKSVSGVVDADVNGNPGNVTNVGRTDDVAYRQTHEIALSHPWCSSTGVKFSGGTYTQEGGVKVTLENGFALVDSYISGLIPIIEGASVDMDIVVAGDAVVATADTNGYIQRLGLLAGAVNSGSIEGSSVVVNSDANITLIANKSGAQVEVGLLAGETTSAVTGVMVDIEGSATVQANAPTNTACVGGVIGYAKGAVSKATTTLGGSGTILIKGTSSANTVRVAGVVGHCDSVALSNLTLNSNAANATIQGSAVSTSESYVGGVVGWVRAASSSLKTNVTGGNLTIQGSNASANSMVGGVAGILSAAADGVELDVAGGTLNISSDCTSKDAMACGLFGRLNAGVTVANALVSVDGGALNISANAPGASAFTASMFGYSNNGTSAKITAVDGNALVEIVNGSKVSIGCTGKTSYAAGVVACWNGNGSAAMGDGYALHVTDDSQIEIGKYDGAAATQYVGAVMGKHANALTFATPAVKIEGDDENTHIDLYSVGSNVHAMCGTPADTGSGAHNNLSATSGVKLTNPYLDGMVDTAGATDSVAPVDSVMRLYPELPQYTVTFDSDGGSAVDAQTVYKGEHATEPTSPTKSNYKFNGWYAEGETEAFDFATRKVTGDITLTASWVSCKVTLSYADSTAVKSVGSDGTLSGYGSASTYQYGDGKTWELVGWYSSNDSSGVKVLDASGSFAGNKVSGITNTAGTAFDVSDDITLYAKYGKKSSTVYTLVDTSAGQSVAVGESYLILNRNTAGSASALMNNSTFTKTGIAVNSGATGLYDADEKAINGVSVTDVDTSNYTIWTVESSGGNIEGDYYLRDSSTTNKYLGASVSIFSQKLNIGTGASNARGWNWSSNGLFYTNGVIGAITIGDCSLTYSSSKFGLTSWNGSSSTSVYAYKQASGYSEFSFSPA